MTELRQRSPRQRDAKHLAYVRSLPCCVCGSTRNIEAAHIRIGCPARGKEPLPGLQRKPDDKWTTPLCNYHHQSGILAQHKIGEQEFWFEIHGRNPFDIAERLWIESGGAERAAQPKRAKRERKTAPRKPKNERAKIQSRAMFPAGRKLQSRPFPSRPHF